LQFAVAEPGEKRDAGRKTARYLANAALGKTISPLVQKKPPMPGGTHMNPTQIVPIPGRINPGLHSAKNSTMLQILGRARNTFDDECRPATNDPVKGLLAHQVNVGPFQVTGISAAVESLRDVLTQVKNAHPEVHEVLSTAGMFCARLIRGSQNISNHSWGTAVDISVGGILDGVQTRSAKSDGRTLAGLVAMAPFFNQAGWYWGVGFSTFEDGMHFEVADETIRRWHAEGKLGPAAASRAVTEPNLSIGDRGVEVRQLQEKLLALGFDIVPDGIFGAITQAAVIDYQTANGLVPDGIGGPRTKERLGLT